MTAVDIEPFVGFGPSTGSNNVAGDVGSVIPRLQADVAEAQEDSRSRDGPSLRRRTASPTLGDQDPVIPVGSPFPANR